MDKKNIEEKGAIVQNNERYAIAPHYPGGMITVEQLRKLADVAEKYKVDAVKVTAAQRISLIGIDEDKLDAAWEDVGADQGMAIGMCVRSIKFCPGSQFCPYGQNDTIKMGLRMDKAFHGRQLPFKFKLGVSGCTRDCSETCIKDVGLVAFKSGWKLVVGGNGGPAPRLSVNLAKGLSDDDAFDLSQRILDLFEKEGGKMRIGKWIAQIGFDEFKQKLGIEE